MSGKVGIFPERFYSSFLDKEYIGVTKEGKFTILPEESFFNYVIRFMTFRQNPHIDGVHNRLKELLEKAARASNNESITDRDILELQKEIHEQGETKYRILEENLIHLRKKMDEVGQLNFLSQLILKVINIVFRLIGKEPICFKTYASHNERTFEVQHSMDEILNGDLEDRSDLDFINPLARIGLQLTESDKKSCLFAAEDPIHCEMIKKLEKGLTDVYLIYPFSRTVGDNENRTTLVVYLEIRFDAQKGFSAVLCDHLLEGGFHSQRTNISNKRMIRACERRAQKLSNVPDEKRTFECLIEATKINQEGEEVSSTHRLSLVIPKTMSKFPLQASSPFQLEPGVKYRFSKIKKDKNKEIASLKIINSPFTKCGIEREKNAK